LKKKHQGRVKKINKCRMVLPYPGPGMAGKIRRVSAKYSVTSVFKSSNTVGQNLVKLKDRVMDIDKRGVVYQVPLQCGKVYIGESGRLFGKRKNDHNNYILQKSIKNFAIFEHLSICHWICGEKSPRVIWSKAGVLAQERDRGVKLQRESLEIKLRTGQHVNRNSGSPEIPDTWLRAAKCFDQKRK
jgi:hypothetical protein